MASEAALIKRSKLARRLYPSLASWEILLWISLWTFGVGYSILHVYWASKRYWRYLDHNDFDVGYFSASRKDVSDNEWMLFSQNLVSLGPWLLLHTLGTQYFQRCHVNMIPVFHTLLPLLYLWQTLESYRLILLLIAQPLFMFLVAEATKKSLLVWMSAILIIVGNDQWIISSFKNWAFDDLGWHIKYLTHVCMFWINSRCVSFCLDHIWKDVPEEPSRSWKFLKMLAFCFYLPISIQGPLINYKDYVQGIYSPPEPWSMPRITEIGGLFLRYCFWYCCVELWLHFIYVCALKHEVQLLGQFDMWTLAGMGYSIGQFFMMKYVFFYGMTRPFLKADGIQPPDHPKCIGRIHLYSDMWRYFDVGLHNFMHRYIYQPVIGTRKGVGYQLLAAMICFTFVYLWHGIIESVLKWSFLNCCGVVLESLSKSIWKTESYQKIEKSLLSPRGQRRFHAALAAPLYLMSIVSNMYFLIGHEAGNVFMKRAFTTWPWGTPVTLFFMFCGSQTSIEVKNWEIWKELAKLSDEHTN